MKRLRFGSAVPSISAAARFGSSSGPSTLIGIPYDRPVIGYGGKTINTLRLWAAATPHYFDFQQFSSGDFVGALAETLTAETITRVLYPDDSTSEGKGLRFLQEYFLVACTLADAIRRFRAAGNDWRALPDKVAMQLNDTHPTLAVAELMRILLDDAGLGWDEAWDLTTRTLAYTNHTLLPEALEKWPLPWFEKLLPRQLEIIYEINRRFLDEVRAKFPGDDGRVVRVSLIEEGTPKQVRMAHLAIVGSHSTNGVAALHSELLKKTVVPDFAAIFPERFNNKTNGVTQRQILTARQSAARPDYYRSHWRRLDYEPRTARKAEASGGGRGISREPAPGQTGSQRTLQRLAQGGDRKGSRSGHAIRYPNQAYPRVQAAALERAAYRGALQSLT